MCFRLGDLGLGYYRDGVLQISVPIREPRRPAVVHQLELAELIPLAHVQQPDQLDVTTINASAAVNPISARVRRGKRRGARGIVSVLDGP